MNANTSEQTLAHTMPTLFELEEMERVSRLILTSHMPADTESAAAVGLALQTLREVVRYAEAMQTNRYGTQSPAARDARAKIEARLLNVCLAR